MNESKTVAVLLATRNGIRFLDKQLESIFSQEFVKCKVFFIDDNSSDGTKEVLQEWMNKGYEIYPIMPDQAGLPGVFFTLVDKVGRYSYYAFADQDDIWRANHLWLAVDKLKNGYEVCSGGREYIDENGKNLTFRKHRDFPVPSFSNALVQNIAYGNTIVFSSRFRDILLQFDSSGAVMHDSWFYLISTYFDMYFLDPTIHVSYRLHSNNATGIRNRNFFSVLSQQQKFSRQATSFQSQLRDVGSINHNSKILSRHVEALSSSNLFVRLNYFRFVSTLRKPVFFGFILGFLMIGGLLSN